MGGRDKTVCKGFMRLLKYSLLCLELWGGGGGGGVVMKCLFCVCGTKMLQFNLQDPHRVLTVRPQAYQDLDCYFEITGNPFVHSSLNYSKLFVWELM
jgi:hypothetical protein